MFVVIAVIGGKVSKEHIRIKEQFKDAVTHAMETVVDIDERVDILDPELMQTFEDGNVWEGETEMFHGAELNQSYSVEIVQGQ